MWKKFVFQVFLYHATVGVLCKGTFTTRSVREVAGPGHIKECRKSRYIRSPVLQVQSTNASLISIKEYSMSTNSIPLLSCLIKLGFIGGYSTPSGKLLASVSSLSSSSSPNPSTSNNSIIRKAVSPARFLRSSSLIESF